jgi:hypothetical protein
MRRFLLFRSHRSVKLAALIVLALLTVASCGSQEGSQGDQSGGKDRAGADGSTGSAQSATTAETTERGEQKGGGQKDVEQKGGGQKDEGQKGGKQKSGGQKGGATTTQTATGAMKVRDGTFRVDKAGTVEFQVNDSALDLRDVNPNSGWRQRIAAQSSDDVEVHFLKGNVDWKFEVEIDANNMEISEEQDISQARGGTYKVGDAGEVQFRSDGSSLTLVNVQANNGWKVTKRELSSDDIEIDFRQGRAKAEFGAELDDSGRLSLEINQKLKGPVPS